MDEMPTVAEVSRVVTEFTYDRCPRRFHQFQANLLALKRKAMLVREAIMQKNEALEGMRAVCVKSTAKLTYIGN